MPDHGVDARLSRLEGLFERFMEESRTERDEMRSDIHAIRKTIADRSGVNWGAVSVMVTAIALAAALIGYIMSDQAKDLEAHILMPAHTDALSKHFRRPDWEREEAKLEKIISQLDGRIRDLEHKP